MGVLKVTTIGNSVGVILPKEILERLRVKRGDSLYVIETKNGIELTSYDPEFARHCGTSDARRSRRLAEASQIIS